MANKATGNPATRVDPPRSFNFEITIDKIATASFSECSGLTADGDAVDYREGTDAQLNVRKLHGLRKYGPITCKRGYRTDLSNWSWFVAIMNGIDDRRNVTITLCDEQQTPLLLFHLENAWINKIEGPIFKAAGNDVAIESMEIIHEGLTCELAKK